MIKAEMGKIVMFAASLILNGLFLQAEKLMYREQTGNRSETHTYIVESRPGGYLIHLSRRQEGNELQDQCLTDPFLNTLEWKFSDLSEKTEVAAFRKNDIIFLSGRHEGQPIEKQFEIDVNPWKQLFSIDFQSFAALGDRTAKFWAIGTAGQGDMKIAKFSARIKGSRSITILGQSVEAMGLRISLSGILSLFWHGDYWLRKSDGRYLRYEGRNGLFGSITVKELISEEP